MAYFNLVFYSGKDNYSDGDIENTILEMVQKKDILDLKNVEDYAVAYHLSSVRENILNWYPFEKNSSVLEIGSGCGAITGMLCEKVAKVVSVELSKRRATINYIRHKDYDNLEIIVGNLNEMNFDTNFDYIVLNGVFEYAMSFTEGSNPYQDFLMKIKSHLNTKGKVLIAIENRLGLKYFAGASEDHTKSHFIGLNNYKGVNSVRTFSKSELETLLNKAGLINYKFYYPYPDYKFPTEIFTDDSIDNMNYGNIITNYEEDRLKLFEQSNVFKALSNEGVISSFANSFLVEASSVSFSDVLDIIYVKLSGERKLQYSIATIICKKDNKKMVLKQPLNKNALLHIKQIKENTFIENDYYSVLKDKSTNDDLLVFDYLDYDTFDKILYKAVLENDTSNIKLLLDLYCNTFFPETVIVNESDIYCDEFRNLFGNSQMHRKEGISCVKPANVDLIFDNIFIDENDRLFVIDCEWVYDLYVPSSFVIWRAINEFYNKHIDIVNCININQIFEWTNINVDEIQVFRDWANYFADIYIGAGLLSKLNKNELEVSVDRVANDILLTKKIDSKLYIDIGQGYSEDTTIISYCNLNSDSNKFNISYDISGYSFVKGLRWDPSDHPCECSNIQIFVDNEETKYSTNCNENSNNCQKFFFDDAQYTIKMNSNTAKKVVIQGYFEHISDIEAIRYLNNLNSNNIFLYEKAEVQKSFLVDLLCKKETELNKKDRKLKIITNELNDAYTEIKDYKKSLESLNAAQHELYNSVSWKITSPIRKTVDIIRNKGIAKEKVGELYNNFLLTKSKNVTYNIDVCELAYEKISISGWAIKDGKGIDNTVILLKNEKEEFSITASKVECKDVNNVFKTDSANLGFELYTNYYASLKTQVFIIFFSGEVEYKFYLGEIQATRKLTSSVIAINKIMPFSNSKSVNNYMIEDGFDYNTDHIVDIIVPVYNGFEYLENLFDSIEKTNVSHNVIIVNDKSSDDRVLSFLQSLIDKNSNYVLLNNNENKGFVQSVNRALKETVNDVVIVNTDVVLPKKWLERMIKPLILFDNVASATPFTNSGTICSFPVFCENNDIYLGLNVDQVDEEFNKICPRYQIIPTGVGFCMAMSRKAIEAVGLFDAETFYKGYGEENDWCQRAIKHGFDNIMVENLFVWHKHGGSFLSEDKKRYIERNGKLLLEKHPNYDKDVAEYCQSDPMFQIRNVIKWQLISKYIKDYVIVFDHNWGGGATTYIYDLINSYGEDDLGIIRIMNDVNYGLLLELRYKDNSGLFQFDSLEDISLEIKHFNCREIIVNELVSFDNIKLIQNYAIELKDYYKVKLVFMAHDLYSICPSIYLMNMDGVHCFKPDVSVCRKCIKENENTFNNNYTDIDVWRAMWLDFLDKCDEIRTFSENTKEYFMHWYPELNNITVVPHVVDYIKKVPEYEKTNNIKTIAIIGNFMKEKGADIVEELSQKIKDNNYNWRIVVIGPNLNNCKDESIIFHGTYKREELPDLICKYEVDIVFIASIVPETFSYTTEEAMQMNLPIMSFNIGAPAERIKEYEKGYIINDMSADKVTDLLCKIF